MAKFYNELNIQSNELVVYRNATVDAIIHNSLFVLVPMCQLFSGVLIHFLQTPIKYLCIPISILLVIYYKLFYMRAAESDRNKLSIDSSQIVYRVEFDEYIIPFANIRSVEDKPIFYDSPGNRNRGWNHSFVLRIKRDSYIRKKHENGVYQFLRQSSDKNVDLKISDLYLEHIDHLRLMGFIHEHIL